MKLVLTAFALMLVSFSAGSPRTGIVGPQPAEAADNSVIDTDTNKGSRACVEACYAKDLGVLRQGSSLRGRQVRSAPCVHTRRDG